MAVRAQPDLVEEARWAPVGSAVSGCFTAQDQQLAVAAGSSIDVWDLMLGDPQMVARHHSESQQPQFLLATVPLSSQHSFATDALVSVAADGCLSIHSWQHGSWSPQALTTLAATPNIVAAVVTSQAVEPQTVSIVVGCQDGRFHHMQLTCSEIEPPSGSLTEEQLIWKCSRPCLLHTGAI